MPNQCTCGYELRPPKRLGRRREAEVCRTGTTTRVRACNGCGRIWLQSIWWAGSAYAIYLLPPTPEQVIEHVALGGNPQARGPDMRVGAPGPTRTRGRDPGPI